MLPLSALAPLLLLAPSALASILAVDYGAEWTKISLVKPGTPFDVVLNKDSKRKVQSVVGWKKDERLFGGEASAIVSTPIHMNPRSCRRPFNPPCSVTWRWCAFLSVSVLILLCHSLVRPFPARHIPLPQASPRPPPLVRDDDALPLNHQSLGQPLALVRQRGVVRRRACWHAIQLCPRPRRDARWRGCPGRHRLRPGVV